MSHDDGLIYSHRRALTFWLIASGVFWIAAVWAFVAAV